MNRFSVIVIAAMLALAGCGVFVISRADTPKTAPPPEAPKSANIAPPADSTRLLVSVPELDIKDVPTEYAKWNKESALRHGFMHVKGTGFPWQRGANVYLAGHDLGYPATSSWRLLWHLRDMDKGDRVIIEDKNGTRYTYRAYKEFEITPDETHVLEPSEAGKSIVTLQSCVPHYDWSKRLLVRAELVKVEEK